MNEFLEASENSSATQRAAVEGVISDYFLGMFHRDLERLRRAFHPSAVLFGHLDGVFAELLLEDWLAKVKSRPIPAENGEPFDMKILSIDITGQIAAAKVMDLYRGLRFTDYLHLAKVNEEWRIVNKTFHHD